MRTWTARSRSAESRTRWQCPAINRQVAHYAYHCGQIVFLAKHLQSSQWKALTVPRGKSEEFNQRVAAKEISQR